jgi:hypothetical protein
VSGLPGEAARRKKIGTADTGGFVLIVRVRRKGDTRPWSLGCVVMVSKNGAPLGIVLEGAVSAGDGIIVEFLPLLFDEEIGAYRGVMIPDVYEVEEWQDEQSE